MQPFKRGVDPYRKLVIGNYENDFLNYFQQLQMLDESNLFDVDTWKGFDTYDNSRQRDIGLSIIYNTMGQGTSFGICKVTPQADDCLNYELIQNIWRSIPQKAIDSLLEVERIIDFVDTNYTDDGEPIKLSASFYIVGALIDIYCGHFNISRDTNPIKDLLVELFYFES